MLRFHIAPNRGNRHLYAPPIKYWLSIYLGFTCNRCRSFRLFSTKRLHCQLTIYGLPRRTGGRRFTMNPDFTVTEHDQLDA